MIQRVTPIPVIPQYSYEKRRDRPRRTAIRLTAASRSQKTPLPRTAADARNATGNRESAMPLPMIQSSSGGSSRSESDAGDKTDKALRFASQARSHDKRPYRVHQTRPKRNFLFPFLHSARNRETKSADRVSVIIDQLSFTVFLRGMATLSPCSRWRKNEK